jgi:hypothetical protein
MRYAANSSAIYGIGKAWQYFFCADFLKREQAWCQPGFLISSGGVRLEVFGSEL